MRAGCTRRGTARGGCTRAVAARVHLRKFQEAGREIRHEFLQPPRLAAAHGQCEWRAAVFAARSCARAPCAHRKQPAGRRRRAPPHEQHAAAGAAHPGCEPSSGAANTAAAGCRPAGANVESECQCGPAYTKTPRSTGRPAHPRSCLRARALPAGRCGCALALDVSVAGAIPTPESLDRTGFWMALSTKSCQHGSGATVSVEWMSLNSTRAGCRAGATARAWSTAADASRAARVGLPAAAWPSATTTARGRWHH